MKMMRLFFLTGILALTACTTVDRMQSPEMMFNKAVPAGFESGIRYISTDPDAIKSHFSRIIQRRHAIEGNAALNILALSGGGAGGSFGAGALVGWSRQGNRPQFDMVTGVSAGALIAPFAFLGSAWDERLDENFSGGHSNNFLVSQGIDMLFNPGVYKNQPLIEFVNRFVTEDMIKEVAAQAALGRMLLVATTDLDMEESVIWDLGKIAIHGGEDARRLFRNVLVASASIPGVFPPIIIPVEIAGVRYDEMHVDGSATVPFFIAPALAFILPLDADGLKGANIYVFVNGQLVVVPQTTGVNAIPILSRSFDAALNHMVRTQIALTAEFARRYGMNLRLTLIPIDYPFQGPLDFQESASRQLFDYGADCAQSGRLWTTVEQSITRNQRALPMGFEKNKQNDTKPVPSCPLDDPSVHTEISTQPR